MLPSCVLAGRGGTYALRAPVAMAQCSFCTIGAGIRVSHFFLTKVQRFSNNASQSRELSALSKHTIASSAVQDRNPSFSHMHTALMAPHRVADFLPSPARCLRCVASTLSFGSPRYRTANLASSRRCGTKDSSVPGAHLCSARAQLPSIVHRRWRYRNRDLIIVLVHFCNFT